MSIEITIYPHNVERNLLEVALLSMGYRRTGHLWDWPEGTKHFHWYETQDFKSDDGVEVTVFPISESKKKDHPQCTWAVHTRTRISASAFDLEMQNETIRSIRGKYGGSFYGDTGTNRYIQVDPDTRPPEGRGLFKVYDHICQELDAMSYTLPKDTIILGNKEIDSKHPMYNILVQAQPTRALYNTLVSFAVAALESFFREIFIILLMYNHQNARVKIADSKAKIEMTDAMELANGTLGIEELLARNYTFQNLAQVNRAFREWFSIDVQKILQRRRSINHRKNTLNEHLADLIERRHDFIHRFSIDRSLSQDQVFGYLRLVQLTMDEILGFLEDNQSIEIGFKGSLYAKIRRF